MPGICFSFFFQSGRTLKKPKRLGNEFLSASGCMEMNFNYSLHLKDIVCAAMSYCLTRNPFVLKILLCLTFILKK